MGLFGLEPNTTDIEKLDPMDFFITEIEIKKVHHLKDIVIPICDTERKSLILTSENGDGKSTVLTAITEYLANQFFPIIASTRNNSGVDIKFQGKEFFLMLYDPKLIFGGKPFIYLSYDCNYSLVKSKIEKFITSTFLTAISHSTNLEKAIMAECLMSRILSVLRNLYQDPNLDFEYGEKDEFIITTKDREPFSFANMSKGYASIFSLMLSIIMEMSRNKSEDWQAPGIVIVDELDLHLSLSMQKRVFPLLREFFPNVQFIISTHSPFIMNSAENTVLYDLTNNILVSEGLTNVSYSGIIEGYFNVEEISIELRKMLDKYRKLANKEEWTDRDYVDASNIEINLDSIPDFLSGQWKVEYECLKSKITKERGE